MKFNGQRLTDQEFKNLKRGNWYVSEDENDGDLVREFDHFSHKNPEKSAVNSDGKVNRKETMRWLTSREAENQGLLNKCETKTAKTKVSDRTMSCKSTMETALCTVKSETKDAAWRTAANQVVKSAKQPLVAFLKSKNVPVAALAVVASVLETEEGSAAFSLLLGTAMAYLPNNDCRMKRLAEECRVSGYAGLFGRVADTLISPLREQLSALVAGVPFNDE